MQSSDRQVGELPGLDRLRPGSHVCCVVDSSTVFERWTAECLAEGARHGEKLFRFGPQPRANATRGPLPDSPSVTVVDPRVAFLDGGPVDPAAMYAMFRSQTTAARREGYRGLRLVADMDWLLAAAPSRQELTAFELLLDQVVTELDATVVCAYRTKHFDAATIAEMVAVHPITVGTAPTDPGFRLWNIAGNVWEMRGEIDYFNAEPFGRTLAVAAAETSALRLKATGLTFVAVAGVQAIVQLALARPDLRLVIEDPSQPFRRCWELFHLDQHVSDVVFESHPAVGPSPDQPNSAIRPAEDAS